MTYDWLNKKTYPLDGYDRLCMAVPGESHYWRGKRRLTLGSVFKDCPEHDGAEKSVTTEPLHVHECYRCEGIFTHADDACHVGTWGNSFHTYLSPRFVCWICAQEIP